MATNFPITIQTFSNPTSTDLLENETIALDHDYQHTTENDTLFALQTKVGVDGSEVTTTHDYKLSGVATGDKAVSKTGVETLTNKTLTAPQINFGSDAAGDMIYRGLDGVTKRIAIGTYLQIMQVSSSGIPEWVANPSATTATASAAGIVELATTAETETGTDATRAVTPDGLHDMTTLAGAAWFLDEDNMSSDSATKTASQQSIKAYVDTEVAGAITYTSNTDEGVTTWTTISQIPDTDLGWSVSSISSAYFANGVSLNANTNTYAYIPFIGKAGSSSGSVAFSDSGWQFRTKCSFININTTTANRRLWFGFTTGGSAQDSSDITNTSVHRVGLAWYNGALYFVTCDGSAVTATNIATRAGTVWDMVIVDFDKTTARVWLNGTAYTTTSTLPTTGTIRLLMGGYDSGGGSSGFSINGLNISTKFNA